METAADPPRSSDRPPSVDTLARSLRGTGLPQPLLVDVARRVIAEGRVADAAAEAEEVRRRLLQPVINATGVLLHTNLGRAPFGYTTAATPTNLELRLADGRRGSRSDHVATLFARLVDAEAALVVNNCSAALLLVLGGLAAGRGVAVSRGELVEIGGGFRVPEVMTQSGARLVEVGTTNRTRRADFERAVTTPGADVAAVLKVHQSNYRIVGFTEGVEVDDLAGLGVPVVADIGSGLLDAACPWLDGPPPAWLDGEPAARQTLRAGADVVLFSADKLLGGPQAGIIVGRADLVAACAGHPLARALRPGGLVLGALQQVALAYLDRTAGSLPFWRMATRTVDGLRARAEALGVGTPVDLTAVPGGGTLPGVEIPSAGVRVRGDHLDALRLRGPGERPIIARVRDGHTEVDLRTVEEADDAEIAAVLRGRTA